MSDYGYEDEDTQLNELIDGFDNLFKNSTRDISKLTADILSILKADPNELCANALAYSLFTNSSTNARLTDTIVRATAAVFKSHPEFSDPLVADSTLLRSRYYPSDFYTEVYTGLEEQIEYGLGDNDHEPRYALGPSLPPGL